MKKHIRVLMTKLGQDGHDRGVKVITSMLRDAGLEVIYTGPWQTPESVTQVAIQEDVDIIGISSLTFDHPLIYNLMGQLKKNKVEIPIIAGGIIPTKDARDLENAGVKKVFHPGSTIDSILEIINNVVVK